MNIEYNINNLLKNEYNPYNYIENKSSLFKILDKIDKNKESLNNDEAQKNLENINIIVKKLSSIQNEIKTTKSDSSQSSIFKTIILKLNKLIILFKKSVYGNYNLKDLIILKNKIEDEIKNRKRFSLLQKFKSIVKKVQKTIAVGLNTKNSIPLEKNYWLEAIGMKIIAGQEIFKGHLYTGYFASGENYPEKWKNSVSKNNIIYQKQYSFQEYLNQVIIPGLSPKELEQFQEKLSIVEYYSDKQLASLEAHFDHEGRIYTITPILNAWVEHKEDKSKQLYTDFYKGYPSPTVQRLVTKHLLRDQTYMYVLDYKGQLYLQIKNRGKTNHTSLSRGHAVLAAGSLKVKDGKIISIDTFSGHYKPTKTQLITLLEFLKKAHVNINVIKLTYVAEYNVQPWIIKEINPGEVQDWMDKMIK